MEVEFARGRLRNALNVFLTVLAFFGTIGLVLGAVVAALDNGDGRWEMVFAFGVIFLLVGVVAIAYLAAWWLASAARVTYAVRDDGVVVGYRGRRLIASFDASEASRIEVFGAASYTRLFFGLGTEWSVYDDLPRLRVYLAEGSGALDVEFPAILIIGRRDAEMVAHRLATALGPDGLGSRVSSTS